MKTLDAMHGMVVLSLACHGLLAGCGSKAEDCENTGTCRVGAVSKPPGVSTVGGTSANSAAPPLGGNTDQLELGGAHDSAGEAGMGQAGSNCAGTDQGLGAAGALFDGAAGAPNGRCTSGCSGSTPICKESTGACVECVVDSDCAFPTTCKPQTGVCVGCTLNEHCPAERPLCNVSTNLCVQCVSGADCPITAPGCDLNSGTCVACTEDAHCTAPTPACDLPSKTCVACTKNTDCSNGLGKPICDLETRACVTCLRDEDCHDVTGKPACDVAARVCVECTENADCSSVSGRPVCDRATKLCVECIENRDCAGSVSGPVCDPAKRTCVGCLANGDCAASTGHPFCETVKQQCVACLANSHCGDPTASRCDATTNDCKACVTDGDCSQITGKSACRAETDAASNRCAECTVTNEKACAGGKNSCDPRTSTCTPTKRGSRGLCQTCSTDSECGNADGDIDLTKRCVPMMFEGKLRPTGYCLQKATSGCFSPYNTLLSATSLSGAASAQYCGLPETTTCEAVLDLIAWKTCANDSACGAGEGGLCRNFGVLGAPENLHCTVACSTAAQCPDSYQCSSDIRYCR